MMKNTSRFLLFVLTISTVILSACGGVAIPTTSAGDAVQTIPAAFIGVVESIVGNQWTISGRTVQIDPTVVNDGPFTIGDAVKVELAVNQDGSLDILNVESPSAEELSTLPQLGDANSNDSNTNDNINNNFNENDANTNDVNSNDNNDNGVNTNEDNNNVNSNDNSVNSNDNSNDDNSNNNQNNNDANSNDNDNDSSGPGSGGDNGGNDNGGNNNGG
jgi:hypothetical protein